MRCPFCGNIDTQVKDSRPAEDHVAIRRRRYCPACAGRFTTYERVQLRDLVVVKKNGKREEFDRDKLERSIRIALQKRPVEPERVDQMISGIVRRLESLGDSDVASDKIGEIVMETLAGTTWPNPSVGCVIVKDNRILGRGHTQKGGRPHAEVLALGQAGDAAKGATAYVTLEPCSHHGKSPPCTDALIKAGIARVVIAQCDPDPRINGLKALEAAGITITIGIRTIEAESLHQGFTTKVTQKRPFICLKIATTLDGKIATQTGESRWITGAHARGLTRILCEGGGTLAASLLAENLVDELVVFTAGKVIGTEGISAIGSLDLTALNLAPRFKRVSIQAIGEDIMSVWRP